MILGGLSVEQLLPFSPEFMREIIEISMHVFLGFRF
jgi:hypothetical protein